MNGTRTRLKQQYLAKLWTVQSRSIIINDQNRMKDSLTPVQGRWTVIKEKTSIMLLKCLLISEEDLSIPQRSLLISSSRLWIKNSITSSTLSQEQEVANCIHLSNGASPQCSKLKVTLLKTQILSFPSNLHSPKSKSRCLRCTKTYSHRWWTWIINLRALRLILERRVLRRKRKCSSLKRWSFNSR